MAWLAFTWWFAAALLQTAVLPLETLAAAQKRHFVQPPCLCAALDCVVWLPTGKTAVCSKAAANHQVRASHAINKEMWRRFVVQIFYWKNAVRPERGDTRLPLVQSVAPANAPCSHKVNFAVSRSTRAPDKLQIQGRGQQQALSHPHQLYTQGSACMCHNRLQSTQAICLHTHILRGCVGLSQIGYRGW